MNEALVHWKACASEKSLREQTQSSVYGKEALYLQRSSFSWASTPGRFLSWASYWTSTTTSRHGVRRRRRVVDRRRRETWKTADCRRPTSSTRPHQLRMLLQRAGSRTAPRVAAVHASVGRGSCWSDLRIPAIYQVYQPTDHYHTLATKAAWPEPCFGSHNCKALYMIGT